MITIITLEAEISIHTIVFPGLSNTFRCGQAFYNYKRVCLSVRPYVLPSVCTYFRPYVHMYVTLFQQAAPSSRIAFRVSELVSDIFYLS